MALDRPAYAPETADRTTARAAVARFDAGSAGHGALAHMFTPPPPPPPPHFWPRQTGGRS